jgi:hypothetical protein
MSRKQPVNVRKQRIVLKTGVDTLMGLVCNDQNNEATNYAVGKPSA